MDKAVEDFRKAMAATRTGRASVHMLDAVSVDYYGSQMPLNQIAQVHAPGAAADYRAAVRPSVAWPPSRRPFAPPISDSIP